MVVEPFFQGKTETDLFSQVNWLQQKIGFSDYFFSKLLRVEETMFHTWRTGKGSLPEDTQDHLKELWQTMLHLLSFMNFDHERVQIMLHHVDQSDPMSANSLFTPPWLGTSATEYMEEIGPASIQKITDWIHAVRFANSN